MEEAYEEGYLDEHRELVNLARLYLHNDIPYEAAKVLQKGMESGFVEQNAESWKLLADSFLQARERESAVAPLARAAELSEDGGLYVRLAQLEIDTERWGEARSALEAALAKGGLADTGNVYLLLGVANLREGRNAEARRAFTAAQKYEKTKGAAAEWLARLAEQQRAATQPAKQGDEGRAVDGRDPSSPSSQ
jgi:tetratricopeptide (TPR) repeat protein